MNILKNLKWRNYIDNITKNKNCILNNKLIFYFGFDPTYKSLHIGHLLIFFLIKEFLYKKKNKIFIILGQFTTKINNFKNHIIIKNLINIKKQIKCFSKKILKKKIYILNNNKWLSKINLYKYITNITKNINLNYLLKKKIINKNFKNINFNQVLYSTLQAYDYFYLYKKYKCNIQIGGSDQWSNIILGIKLIKKIFKKKVYGLTYPLLTDNNNIKFSKSNKIFNIWLNKKKNSPFIIYQYFINLSDTKSLNLLKKCTLIKIKYIKKIIYIYKKNLIFKKVQHILSKIFLILLYNYNTYMYSKLFSYYLYKKNNNFLKLKYHLYYIKNNILYFKINFKKIYNIIFLMKILKRYLKISLKKINLYFKNNIIKFNYKIYKIFIKKKIINKYVIGNIGKLFFFIKIICL